MGDSYLNDRALRSKPAVLLVSIGQQIERWLHARGVIQHPGQPVGSNPPEPVPVIVVHIDKQTHPRVVDDVGKPSQSARSFGLIIDHGNNDIVTQAKDDGHQMRPGRSQRG